MEIIVGRRGEQSFPIMDKAVSGKHLKLTTMPDGNVQVEDLESTNGTFIDGVRIIKKVVSRNTIVQMGSTFTFCISDVLPEVNDEILDYKWFNIGDDESILCDSIKLHLLPYLKNKTTI